MINRIKNELRYGRSFIIFSATKTFGQGIFFLLFLVAARLLTPDRFGAYSLGMLIIYFFAALFVTTSQSPFIVLANEERQATGTVRKAFTARLFLFMTAMVLFCVLATVFAGPFMRFSVLTRGEFGFLLLAYVGVCIRYFVEGLFLGLNKKQTHAWFGTITNVVALLLVGTFYAWGGVTLSELFLTFFISPLVALVFVIGSIEWRALFPLTFDRKLVTQFLGYIKWTVVGVTSVYFINWGDNFVLRHFVTLADIGVYNLGYQIFKGMIILIGIVQAYYLPSVTERLVNAKDKLVDSFLGRVRWKIFGLGVLGVAVLWLVLPTFFRYVYEPEYAGAAPVTRVLLIGAIFALYQSFYAVLYDAAKRYKFTQLTNTVGVIINLSLDWLLVRHYGIMGTAVATAITYITLSVIYEGYFRGTFRTFLGKNIPEARS